MLHGNPCSWQMRSAELLELARNCLHPICCHHCGAQFWNGTNTTSQRSSFNLGSTWRGRSGLTLAPHLLGWQILVAVRSLTGGLQGRGEGSSLDWGCSEGDVLRRRQKDRWIHFASRTEPHSDFLCNCSVLCKAGQPRRNWGLLIREFPQRDLRSPEW